MRCGSTLAGFSAKVSELSCLFHTGEVRMMAGLCALFVRPRVSERRNMQVVASKDRQKW